MARVLVISLGEISPDLVARWSDEGRLPNLKSFAEQGFVGRLTHRTPTYNTPQLWATVQTGRSPGWHGIFDYWQRGTDGRFREISGDDLRAEPVWHRLGRAGLPGIVANVPMTYPPAPFEGTLLSGQDAPGPHRSIAHPRSVYDDITARFGPYHLKYISPGGKTKEELAPMLEEDVRWYSGMMEFLLKERPWRFAMIHFVASAYAQHYFWADMEDEGSSCQNVLADTYAALDDAIGRLAEAAGPETTIFVVSECGAGPLRSGIQLNSWLERGGFLRYLQRENAGGGGPRRALRSLVSAARSKGQAMLPLSLYYAANRHLRGLKSWVQSYTAGSDIDWTETRAFFRGKGEANLYINLRGRDPHGIVEPGSDYDRTCDELREHLLTLRDPHTGDPAVTAVHRSSDLFPGPHAHFAPDLLIDWADAAYMPTESDRGKDEIFVERWREYMDWPTTGSHRPEGLLAVRGPTVAPGTQSDPFDLVDLVPTWLRVLGQPVDEDLEGRPIAPIVGALDEGDLPAKEST